MILPKDVFSEAYDALRNNRRRSAITMMGMAWGIATVVLLLAYGTGFSTAIVNIFKAYASMQARCAISFSMQVIGPPPAPNSHFHWFRLFLANALCQKLDLFASDLH